MSPACGCGCRRAGGYDVRMKLAYSANAYLHYPVEEAIRRIAALGYRGVELMADVPHAWPAEVTQVHLCAIRGALNDSGLEIANVNAFMMRGANDPRHPYWHPSWIEDDPTVRRLRIEHTRASLRLAAALGAPSITTEPGGPLTPEMNRERAMDMFVAGLEEVLPLAEDLGVRLLVEPEPELLIENVVQTLDLASRVRSPAFGINFDIGHLYCVGEDLPRAVAVLRPFVHHYHIEDIASTRVHAHLVPGEGAIDFGPVLRAIRKTGYDGWVTVELYPYVEDPDGAGARARRYLSPFMAEDVRG